MLKLAISTTPILLVVDPTKPFVVEIDASAIAVGVVLIQDAILLKLNFAQCNYLALRNYSAYEYELFAIIHALKQLRHYLY